jgi:protein TonB
VVLLHAVALWALYAGLQRRAAEPPVAMMRVADVSPPKPAPPAPTLIPAARQTDARPAQSKADVAQAPAPVLPSAAPAPADALASRGSPPVTALAAAPAAAAAPGVNPGAGSAALGSTTAAAPSRVEAPSSEAVHLRNPRPAYPIQSRRLGEQGQVVLRVLVGEDGAAQRAQVQQTSGHDRLDRAALATVLTWRYVPGKRGGVPEAMWFDVPIQFVLE